MPGGGVMYSADLATALSSRSRQQRRGMAASKVRQYCMGSMHRNTYESAFPAWRHKIVVVGIGCAVFLLCMVSFQAVQAYGSRYGAWDSLGCSFSGSTNAQTSYGYANTWRYDSCATYGAVNLKYKTQGSWYGPYWSYQYQSYIYAATYSVIGDISDTYSGHQIYTSGNWQQIEHILNLY